MRIVIFTDRYPYGRSEEAFVANEVEYLATHRGEDTVVVVPLKGGGHCRAVPRGVEVAEPLIRGVRGWRGALALGSLPLRGAFWHFWGETLRCVARGSRLSRTWFSRYVAGELVANYAGAEMRRRAEGVLYSYWMSYGAWGVALAGGGGVAPIWVGVGGLGGGAGEVAASARWALALREPSAWV